MNTPTESPADNAAALLAASPDEYMSASQLAFFRRRLLDEEQALLAAVRATADRLQETEVSADWSDRASAEEEQTLELRVRDRERKLLQKIREALRRIDDGSYGWCAETGEAIGIPRLLARPTATLCLEAQERRERQQRQFGG